MTVSATTPYVAYTGAGTSGPFAIPFRFLADADLVATKTDAYGVETTLTGNTITGAGDDDGGELYTAAAVAVGETLKIYRDTVRAQTAQYVANGPFPAATHERALDKAMLIDQEQARDIGRSLRAPIGEILPPLPTAAARANTILLFDENGSPVLSNMDYPPAQATLFVNDPIIGLIMSNNIALPDVAVDIAPGSCRDKTGVLAMNLMSTLTKRLNDLWAPGSGAGGMDTAASAGQHYYNLFLIYNPEAELLDAVFSTSFNNPVLPAGYTYSRYLGSVVTNSFGAILPFLNVGEWFRFKTPLLDVNAPNSSDMNLRVLSVPRGCKATASIRVTCFGTGAAFLYFRDPDLGPYSTVDTVAARNYRDPLAGNYFIDTFEVETDTLGRIYTSSTSVVPDEAVVIVTAGWCIDRSVYR